MKVILLVLLLCLPWHSVTAAERIIAICETLYAIGAEKEIVGAVSYCDYPSEALAIPRVGNYQKLNIEAALRLNPTMVIVMDRSMNGLQLLESRGIQVIESYPHDIDGVINDIRRIGTVTGHKKQAAELADSLALRLHKVRAQERVDIPVFYEIWGEPLITPGRRSFISSLLSEAGATNVFNSIDLDTARVNIEGVILAAPRAIIIPTESRVVEDRKSFWNRWLGDEVPLIVVQHDLVHRPGPRLMDGLEQIQQALQELRNE